MKRRDFLKAAASGAAGLLAGCTENITRGKISRFDRPNIILIMADDMGFSDIGCYGGEINTPNINKLAEQGMRFSQFYNCALCGPTRASMLTGVYNQQAGIHGWTGTMADKVVTIPELLHENGYTTTMVGRIDMTTPGAWYEPKKAVECFDHYFGSTAHGGPGMSYFNDVYNNPFYLDGKRYELPDNFYNTDALTDFALKFIKDAATKEKPFFFYGAYPAPHWPLHAKEKDISKYREFYRNTGWDKLRSDRYRRLKKEGLIKSDRPLPPRDPRVPPWKNAENKDWQAECMAVYAAQIDCLDQNIGRILKQLKQLGIEDNTIVLFFSDNGPSRAQAPLELLEKWRFDGKPVRKGYHPSIMPGTPDTFGFYGRPWANVSATPFRGYKHTCYEGGISSPLVVRWPAVIKQGRKINHQHGHVIDIMATICDVAGIQYPHNFKGRTVAPLQGKSLMPVLRGRDRNEQEYLFWNAGVTRGVRSGKWKIVASGKRPWQLYDIHKDRLETNDLSDRNKDIVYRLEVAYENWKQTWQPDQD